jgi:alkaline phosphatase D
VAKCRDRGKSKVATSLDDYRGNINTTCLTRICGFNAEVSIFVHWWPGEAFERRGYDTTSALLLAARGCRVFPQFMPLRSAHQNRAASIEKSPTVRCSTCFCLICPVTRRRQTANEQYGPDATCSSPVSSPASGSSRSTATWKVIASDTPVGTIVGHARDALRPLGRGIEIADLLSFTQHQAIRNTIWITADLHYTAAHYFDPNHAAFQDFEPFWEFVSGPIHAGTWTSCALDQTFGPQVVFHGASRNR